MALSEGTKSAKVSAIRRREKKVLRVGLRDVRGDGKSEQLQQSVSQYRRYFFLLFLFLVSFYLVSFFRPVHLPATHTRELLIDVVLVFMYFSIHSRIYSLLFFFYFILFVNT